MPLSKKTRQKFGRITNNLLEVLVDFYDLTDAFLWSCRSTKLFHQRLRENRIAREKIFDRLGYLEKQGYINYKKSGNNLSIRLTKKGQIKLLENSNQQKIDGRWRMISFDIPEEFRARRNRFRRAIKRIGFRQVQKSLWASPFVKADQIEKAIKYYKVKKYVAYLIVEKSDIESYLKKLFSEYFKEPIK